MHVIRVGHSERRISTITPTLPEQVIVAAHAYGSSKLLLRMQHKGRLTRLSSQLGQRARTNSEQLLMVTRLYESSLDRAPLLHTGRVTIRSCSEFVARALSELT